MKVDFRKNGVSMKNNKMHLKPQLVKFTLSAKS